MVDKALLYAKAVKDLSDEEASKLIGQIRNKVGGQEAFDNMRIAAQSACIDAVIKHFSAENSINEAQKSVLESFKISNSDELKKVLEEFKNLDESTFTQKFSVLLDIVKMDENRAKEFFNQKDSPMFAFTAAAQESRTTKQVISRAMSSLVIVGAMLAAVTIFTTVAGVYLAPVAINKLAAEAVGASIFLGESAKFLVTDLSLSAAAQKMGVHMVTAAALSAFQTMTESVIMPIVSSCIGGASFGFGLTLLDCPESISTKIQDTMNAEGRTKLQEDISNTRKLGR